MIINVGAFASDEVCKDLCYLAKVRARALDICYSTAGYTELPLEERNKCYDKVRDEIMREEHIK